MMGFVDDNTMQTKPMDVVSSDVDVRQPELKRRRRVYGVRHFPPGCGPRATRRNVAVSDVVGGVSTLGLLENGADLVGDDEANEVPVLVHLDSSLDDSVVSSDDAADVVESRDLTMSLELDDEIENDVGLRVSKIGSCDLTLSESLVQMDVDEKTDDVESNGDIQTVSPDYTNGLTLESPDSAGSSPFENLESGSEPARLLQDNAIGLSQDSSDADVHAPPKIASMFKYPPRRKVLGVRVFPPNCGRNAKPLNKEEEEEEDEENIGALREMVENAIGEVEDVNVNARSQEGQFESNVLDTKVKESIEKATRSPAEAISCSGDLVMADQQHDELGKMSKVLHNSNRQGDWKGHLQEGQLESNLVEQNNVTSDTNVKDFIEKTSRSPNEVLSCSGDLVADQECDELGKRSKVLHNSSRQGDSEGHLHEGPLESNLEEQNGVTSGTNVQEFIEKASRSPDEVVSCSGDLVIADQECDELGKRSKVLHNSSRQGDSKGHLQEGQLESNFVEQNNVMADTNVKESIEKATRSPDEAISCSGDLVMADQECDDLGKSSKVLHNSNRQENSEGHLHEGQLESNLLELNSVTADTNVKEFIEKASMSPDEVVSCSVDVATPDERNLLESAPGENFKVVHKPNRQGEPKGCLQEDSGVRKAKVAAQREITKLSISKKITKQECCGLKVTKLSILKKIAKQEPGGLKVATNASHKRNKRKKNSTSMARDKSLRPKSSLSENTNGSMKEVSLNLTPFGPGSSKGFASARKKVRETLRLFHFICRKLVHEAEARSNKGKTQIGRVDTIAAKELRNRGMCLNQGQYIVGAVPGVEVGDEFQFRLELNVIGLHRPTQAGIDFVKEGQDFIAVSIVASAGYDNNLDNSDVLDYTGQGDQKLENGNLGLKNSITTQNPVRVIRGYRKKPESADVRSKVYVYDGLYNVEKYWHEPGQDGKLVLKFRMVRIPGQPELAWKQVKKSKKLKLREGLSDISQGKELIPISAVNTVDDENLPPFKYITQIMYPDTLTPPDGCSCRSRCSESSSCSCVAKNGGEIPFNNNGAIVEAKDLVYECGPSCKCPPSCYNRVSQKGISIQLEVFKTGSRGWGVRSMDSISSGSFICEYIGELVDDSEAERRTNDEYLFDLGGNDDDVNATMPSFTIDAAEYGNVGRFINHSCSPNLYAQNVLYDHGDQRIPHIMFFAAENIPPLQELSYHYNYQIDQVHDSQGNIKMKFCYCGSSECTGRMY